MQFATITSLLACLSASSSSSSKHHAAAFVPRSPVLPSSVAVSSQTFSRSSPSALPFAHRVGPDGGREHVVTFTNTAHREEIHLETMSGAQLSQFYDELEALTAACTEEASQTHPLCDVELKDERDVAMLQITTLLQEREKDRLTNDVDMAALRTLLQTPWTQSFATLEALVLKMEALQWECTEEGNQTKPSCDVLLKDERDRAIETLTVYMTAIRHQVSQEEQRQQQAATKQAQKQAVATKKPAQSRSVVPVAATQRRSTPFALGIIRTCVKTPGRHSIQEMQAMVADLEAQQLLCTEDGTQTNAECDLDIKAERDGLMEALVTHITEATSSLTNGLHKAVVADHAAAHIRTMDPKMAMKDVMATVIPTRPNLTPLTNTTTQNTNRSSKPTTTTTSVAAIRNIHHANDDSLVQI